MWGSSKLLLTPGGGTQVCPSPTCPEVTAKMRLWSVHRGPGWALGMGDLPWGPGSCPELGREESEADPLAAPPSPQLAAHHEVHQRPVREVPAGGGEHQPEEAHPRHACALLPVLHPGHRPLVRVARALGLGLGCPPNAIRAGGGRPSLTLVPGPPTTLSSPLSCSSLRPLDIEFMKRLSKVVNIVPVIAKADTLTLEERVYFKQRVGLHSLPPTPGQPQVSWQTSLQLPPPPTPEAKELENVKVTSPQRSQQRPILLGRACLPRGWCPHVSPLNPQITADLLSNGIDVYPQKEFDEDAEDRLVNEKFRVSGGWTRGLRRGWAGLLPVRVSGKRGRVALSPENALSGLVGVGARGATCDHALPSPRR